MKILAALVCSLAIGAAAVQLPPGTELQIRLKSKVASASSKPNELVEAVLIAPVVEAGQVVIPAGSTVRGSVKSARPAAGTDQRALLELEFGELADAAGHKTKLAAKLVEVDNARETVGEDGAILGILQSETLTAKMDQGLGKLAERSSKLAEILGAAKDAFVKPTDVEIVLPPGVEMTLKLTKAAQIKEAMGAKGAVKLESISPEDELIDLVNAQPFQTTAEKPPKPSDITNLMFIGTPEQVNAAFTAAGWATAARLDAKSQLETARAVIEQRGYKEAPVSLLLLDGEKPAMVFQKQHNTFAKRHHLRIWRRPGIFQGKSVWVSAATHDIGIAFSPENRTFIHQIDPQIDRERAKVVGDLVAAGQVKALALVDRPAVPTESQNATGDKLETDGRMAVLVFE